MTFKIGTYTWRGRTYKGISTFMRALARVHPHNHGITFDKGAAYVYADRPGDPPRRAWVYPRTFDEHGNSIIADKPTGGPT